MGGTHGGKRKGAGRKPLGPGPVRPLSIGLSPDLIDRADALRGYVGTLLGKASPAARTEVLREAIRRGLRGLERAAAR